MGQDQFSLLNHCLSTQWQPCVVPRALLSFTNDVINVIHLVHLVYFGLFRFRWPQSLRNRNMRNPFPVHLSINHFRNKIVNLRLILREIGLQYISIRETKLDASFPNAQFKFEGYHFPSFQKDQNCHGGGLIVFVKNYIIIID